MYWKTEPLGGKGLGLRTIKITGRGRGGSLGGNPVRQPLRLVIKNETRDSYTSRWETNHPQGLVG